MPTWASGEMMLPEDGPQGRFGLSLEATLKAATNDAVCSRFQLTALQQLRLLRAFALPQLLGGFVEGRKSAALADEVLYFMIEIKFYEVDNFKIYLIFLQRMNTF